MGLIISKYNEKDLIDKCWYESSNVIYSECIDKKDAYKDLKITFKDGRTYLYKNVTVQDYLLFRIHESQGKALNKYILPKVYGRNKYDFDKLDNLDVSELEIAKQLVLEEKEIEKQRLIEAILEEPGGGVEIVKDDSIAYSTLKWDYLGWKDAMYDVNYKQIDWNQELIVILNKSVVNSRTIMRPNPIKKIVVYINKYLLNLIESLESYDDETKKIAGRMDVVITENFCENEIHVLCSSDKERMVGQIKILNYNNEESK